MGQNSHREFWKALTVEQREVIADQAGTTAEYLRQVLVYERQPSADMAKRLEEATQGVLTRRTLRPDLFADMQVSTQ
ncbi:transcriptional regulator [Halomonas sp. MES3-P3E]|uniref:transcriptional regulator n=1 Tax=Halomonas sp. MES3-P3E TaxID=2058321 RepID=UPI000C3410A6|nr:transcriptional regulator [Halomonas sp. MES3-P3E]PKG50264.1 transcriptional regulator [Halomonas sp. MES3-P3E]